MSEASPPERRGAEGAVSDPSPPERRGAGIP
jgi:hypothetical protein